MDSVATLSNEQREELFLITAQEKRLPSAMVEKDFWVCWTLAYLFHESLWKNCLAFKGGTSLSKCFSLISRFSEDIDLILDWRQLGVTINEPWLKRSKNQQDKFNKMLCYKTERFLSEIVIPQMNADFSSKLRDKFQVMIDPIDGQTVCFYYPRIFSENTILSCIRLEIGALAAWTPVQSSSIISFAAECFPNLFQESNIKLLTVSPERTFWEKVTILHKEAFRLSGVIPSRYSRHYYDLWCMSNTPVKKIAFNDLSLLEKVVDFKDRFYPAASAHYELAKPSTMKLMPQEKACYY